MTSKEKVRMKDRITALGKELDALNSGTKTRSMSVTAGAGKGIIPDSWVPWVDLIEFLLKFIYPWMSAKIRKIIDKILQAINLFQGERKQGV
jgi:hypothetical protein